MIDLRTALAGAPYTQALKDGTVASDRVRLHFVDIARIQDAFPAMVRDQAYDVCQMSPTTYLVARSFKKPITAVPVFLNRHFHHGYIIGGAGVATPKDLEGRRVGIGSWTITTGVWGRAILRAEYGIDLDRIQWISFEDPHVPEFREPPNVIRAAAGKTMNGMLRSGELDGAVAAGVQETDTVRPLIGDLSATHAHWYRRTGIYPIVHTVVVRDSLIAEYPWLGAELLRLFTEAKDVYLERLRREGPRTPDDERFLWQAEVLKGDPLPYGVESNRRSLEALITTCVEQGILRETVAPDSLFV